MRLLLLLTNMQGRCTMNCLESFQHYNDGSPFLNPSDHPYEQEYEEEGLCKCGEPVFDCGMCKECWEKW